MQIELDATLKNGTWLLCDIPIGKSAIETKWVYKLKRKPDGSVDRYKLRLRQKVTLRKRKLILMKLLLPLVA